MRLRLAGVSHSYDGMAVLQDISIDIADQQITCLIGPSGCGKSTLLRLLGGLEHPDQGQVLQYGTAPAHTLNPLTYVFQDFALLPWRSVAGNIALVLEDHPLSRQQRQQIIEDVLARTKLDGFAQAWPRQLSGGMKQRVGIARALAVRPAVLLMDEPLSALDGQTRELLLEDLQTLWSAEPFGAVYVTHNLGEAVRLGHHIVVLSGRPGRVRAVIEVPMALPDRRRDSPELAKIEADLWAIIRSDALAAEQVLRHG